MNTKVLMEMVMVDLMLNQERRDDTMTRLLFN